MHYRINGDTIMRQDYTRYTREDLERIAKWHARAKLVGRIYIGNIGEQTIRWGDDGSIEVITSHEPASMPRG